MHHNLSAAEACALLDRVLQTVQSLSEAYERLFPKVPVSVEAQPANTQIHREKEAEQIVVPIVKRPVAPVLTIKLSDLVREGERAQRRKQTTTPSQRPPAKRVPFRDRRRGPPREVEVIYRKGIRLVS